MLLWLRAVASRCSDLHTFPSYIPQHFSSNCATPTAKNKNAENSPPLQEREQHLPGSTLQFPLGDNMRNRLRSWVLWGEQPLPQQKPGKQNRPFFGKFSCPNIKQAKLDAKAFFPSGNTCAWKRYEKIQTGKEINSWVSYDWYETVFRAS